MAHGSRCRSFKKRVGTLMAVNISQLSRLKHNHFSDHNCSNMTATIKSNIEKGERLVISKDQSSDSDTILNVKSCTVLVYFVPNLLVINI